MTAERVCTGCQETKPLDDHHFYRDSDEPSRFRPRCILCQRAARTARRARKLGRAAGEPRTNMKPGLRSVLPTPVPRAPIGDDEVTEPGLVTAPEATSPGLGEPMILTTTEPPRAERYVITYAQNATPVHGPFLAALLLYCAETGARLVVLPGRYKNPTSVWSQNQEHDEWWAPELAPYLFAGRMEIGRLTVIGDLSIQPTAIRPLTGLEVFAGHNSAVVGHAKVELRTVAGAAREYPRILTTTGAVTVPNYTASKAGKRGEAHHTLGACVVERDPHLFHLRQITGSTDGSFTDLDREYQPHGSRTAPRALALILGDVHVAKIDPVVEAATLRRPDSIAAVLRPERIVYHDTLDFDARNHHTRGDFADRYARVTGRRNDSVEAEVTQAIDFIDRTPEGMEPIVVRSNHDAAYDRWLKEADWKADPINARFWLATWQAVLEEYEATGKWPDAFALVYRQRGSGRARFLRLDESLKVGDTELGFHGHTGINGARGSLASYSKIGARVVIGHGHHPGIQDGATMAGVCALDLGYNALPSSWMSSHVVVYASGARSLINVVRGEWRTARG